MIVFEVVSSEEAGTIMKNDPAVKAHGLQARPFDVFSGDQQIRAGAEAGAEAQNPEPK